MFNITNGFLLKSSDPQEINKVNDHIRHIIQDLIHISCCKIMAQKLTKIVDLRLNKKLNFNTLIHHNHYEIFKDETSESDSDFFKLLYFKKLKYTTKNLFEIIKVMSTDASLGFFDAPSSQAKIYFKTIGNNTLYYFSLENNLFKAFKSINDKLNILDEFDYIDGERPDSISASDWELRRNSWKEILKDKNSTISNSMYLILIDINLEYITKAMIFKYIPNMEERLKNIYRKERTNSLSDIKCEQYCKENNIGRTHLQMHEYMEIHSDVLDIVDKEIEQELYINSNKHIDMLIPESDLLNSIFNYEYEYKND